MPHLYWNKNKKIGITMQEQLVIKKIAVLGAGVMGAQIAAHCVNAGFQTLLFDLPQEGTNKNAIVENAIKNLTKLKPTPLGDSRVPTFIEPLNYEEDLEELSECDLIIEAIAERLDLKESLYKKIVPYLNDKSILVTNTSGLSINTLSKNLPENKRTRFCGVHFFNPPRYMHLVELIPGTTTDTELLDQLETWLTGFLGKTVIRAKDTPNFIANRIGVFSLLVTLHHAEKYNVPLDTVDALTGTLLGRPKSATFRTMDVVGLDTMAHVVHTMREELRDDPWHQYFHLPHWLMQLIEQGSLGQKSGAGVYKKTGKTIEVFDPTTKAYKETNPQISAEVEKIFANKDPKKIMQELFLSKDSQAQFLAMCFRDLFHYSAFHLENIADKVADVDVAMRFGFGWQNGPLETWEHAGFNEIKNVLEQSINDQLTLAKVSLPTWLNDITSFYKEEGSYSPKNKSYKERNLLPVYKKQIFPAHLPYEKRFKPETFLETDAIRVYHLKNNIGVISFKTKANSIGQGVLDGLMETIDFAEKNLDGLIIYQDNPFNFSSGADLKSIYALVENGDFKSVEQMVKKFQHTLMRIKYSHIPVVAALRGHAIAGGCELILHCDAIETAFESYTGLVEVGVGVIPAGGGCTQMALRASERTNGSDLMKFVRPKYEQIAMAKVSSSALEAKDMDYLKPTDAYAMNTDEVLHNALKKVGYLLDTNYLPPLQPKFKVGGIEGKAQLQIGLVNWLKGGFISEYDYEVAVTLAHVICGGDVNQNTLVDENWILNLEREAFVSLLENSKTQERINHWLKTGKPLRN